MPRRKGGPLRLVPNTYESVKDILIPYRRVSTREQAQKGVGLDAQTTALKFGLQMREQQALNWDCTDKGKSGKNLRRDGLKAALTLIEEGKAGGIIVSKLDRLSRSLLDFAHLMTRASQEGWNIVALDLGVDLATPAGKAMASMLAVFAEFERNVISQRTKDGLAEKRAQGIRLGRPPSLRPEVVAMIAEMWDREPNYSQLARWLNAAEIPTGQGGKMWYPMTVSKLIASPAGQAALELLEDAA